MLNPSVFFKTSTGVILLSSEGELTKEDKEKLEWLLQAKQDSAATLEGIFIGPRKEVVSPWSTNATEIASNVGIAGLLRIERFLEFVTLAQAEEVLDPMVESIYQGLKLDSLFVDGEPEAIQAVVDIRGFNEQYGLALSEEEISFLEEQQKKLARPFTDSELYGFAQINSEHCRHKIFNGSFVIDGETKEQSLFSLIKETSKQAPQHLVSAYKDNVAFVRGPKLQQFAPGMPQKSDFFSLTEVDSVISLKAETHNFPTTVEPFNGASTGSGGEIRDRMAGGLGSIPLSGTAVYMTSYPRLGRKHEQLLSAREWKYQTPEQILIKASNGASDFGNKFGQPLTTGSVLTFEAKTSQGVFAYDRAVMLAGGVGYARSEQALKEKQETGDLLILLGGDNYRIGMAGSSVSSVDTGAYSSELELSAVQRANPEMQKRVFNVIRALCEVSVNPIKLIHDHGAGGHLNCFSELVEPAGARIELSKLPLGDPTLSARELLCNESQERMGLIISPEDLPLIEQIAKRERAPLYVIGKITGDGNLLAEDKSGARPFSLPLDVLFGAGPKTVISGNRELIKESSVDLKISSGEELIQTIKEVFQLEAVACKDWLTNKVDRCVSGRVALQQCVGPFQLPLNNLSLTASDFSGTKGIATSLGHAPIAGLLDACAGAELSLAESLTNLLWAPIEGGLEAVALSANWMWPAKQPGEDARLYDAVEALSKFAIELGIPIPTGKDSLSMSMKYHDGSVVRAPGTVVITAVAPCKDVRACVTADLKPHTHSVLLHVNLASSEGFPLGGSSYAQVQGTIADIPPAVQAKKLKAGFSLLQKMISEERLLAGHDISSGGLITSACEMAFAGDQGISIKLEENFCYLPAYLFSENPGVLLQVATSESASILAEFESLGIQAQQIAEVGGSNIQLHAGELSFSRALPELRKAWFEQSYLLDAKQIAPSKAKERFDTFDANPLKFSFPKSFSGVLTDCGAGILPRKPSGVRAAIIREKGTNGDREMAFSLYAAGFDVKDITMTDIISGEQTLEDINFIVFPGGFSNSDVLGAARGWAGVFKYNQRAAQVLEKFYARPDTLSLGVCNGCQLLVALDLICPEDTQKIEMADNESEKFESIFLGVEVQETNNILLQALVGSKLGIWVAHGEGRFCLPLAESEYDIPLKYLSSSYPANPNGSAYNTAAVSSRDGRHLAIMPHLERSLFPWQWGYYPSEGKRTDEVSPWILAFTQARDWIRAVKFQV